MARHTRTAILLTLGVAVLASASIARDDPPGSKAADQGLGPQAVMDEIIAEMKKPGPKRADWSKGGIDVRGLAAAAPGGTRQNYILTTDKGGSRSITVVDGAGATGIIPANWKEVVRIGKPPTGDITTDITIGSLDQSYYFAGTQGRRRVGDAYCTSGPMSGVLYMDKNRPPETELPEDMLKAMFEQMFEQFEALSSCYRYDADGASFRTSSFLEDGSTLPVVDETVGERLQIVSAGPVDQLLAPPK